MVYKMNTVIITLIVVNLVVNIGTVVVLGGKIIKLRKSTQELLKITEMNSHDLCNSKVMILEKIDQAKESALTSNTELKKYIKDCVGSEVPTTIFKFLYPILPFREKK